MANSLKGQEEQLQELWQASMNGDEASYAKLLQILGAALRQFLRRRMNAHIDSSEDLVQEVLLAIHLKRHTYKTGQPLSAWVYAIARYKWIDFLRENSRHGALNDNLDDWVDTLAIESDSEAQASRKDALSLLDELPAKQRQAIEYMRLRGYSIKETAQATGQSAALVKVNVHRGTKTLIALWKKIN